jgi:hypothetical protein
MVLKIRLQGGALNEHINLMLIEKFGYVLSELPVLVLMIWVAVKIVRWRRARENRPPFNEADRRMLFHAAQYGPDCWQFYPRFVLAVLAVSVLGFFQLAVLAPLGAAIVTCAFVLTSSAIVHGVLLRDR